MARLRRRRTAAPPTAQVTHVGSATSTLPDKGAEYRPAPFPVNAAKLKIRGRSTVHGAQQLVTVADVHQQRQQSYAAESAKEPRIAHKGVKWVIGLLTGGYQCPISSPSSCMAR